MISNPGPTPRLFPDGLTKIKDVHIENLRKVQCSSMATLPLDFRTGNELFYQGIETYGIPCINRVYFLLIKRVSIDLCDSRRTRYKCDNIATSFIVFQARFKKIHLYTTSEPVTEITGGPDLFINKDSTINLTCLVRYAPEPPSTIIWSHNRQASVSCAGIMESKACCVLRRPRH
ncbi:hypothetical protein HZH66_013874 [Vespula vulgaris]|uniref:Ig-like domain-containing protein n=1 Tax=Vespula vulgaris TaxID=7454 RepID=A0A834MQK6_VESVU|nr:hypothetical protein HZH66_013874 [Vespula vulgaris]